MTIRTTALNGTDWADGEVFYAEDQNDTLDAISDVILEDAIPVLSSVAFYLPNSKSYEDKTGVYGTFTDRTAVRNAAASFTGQDLIDAGIAEGSPLYADWESNNGTNSGEQGSQFLTLNNNIADYHLESSDHIIFTTNGLLDFTSSYIPHVGTYLFIQEWVASDTFDFYDRSGNAGAETGHIQNIRIFGIPTLSVNYLPANGQTISDVDSPINGRELTYYGKEIAAINGAFAYAVKIKKTVSD